MAENRYQIQLVQEKARQIEIFGQRFASVVGGLATGLELANDPKVISSLQTQRKLGVLLRENPELLALYVKPGNEDSLIVRRSDSLNDSDVETIATEPTQTIGKGGIRIGEPRRTSGSGRFVMSFASDVTIDGAHAATIVAIASLQSVSQGVVGVNAATEEEALEGQLANHIRRKCLWRNPIPSRPGRHHSQKTHGRSKDRSGMDRIGFADTIGARAVFSNR